MSFSTQVSLLRRAPAGVVVLLMAGISLLRGGPAQAAAPTAGSGAPAFKLQDGEGKWHSLGDYRGKWVVLYFYPKDGTPGCTTQACEFRDNVFAFRDANAVILGISVDDAASHKEFAAKHQLPFTLLADPKKEAVSAYGAVKKYPGMGELAARETFLIDPQGKIAKHYADVNPKGHSEAVLKDIKARSKPAT